MPEGCVNDLSRALGIDYSALPIRFKRNLDAGFLI